MTNFIKVSKLGTTNGNITDITFNVEPVLVAAIANSSVLNEVNTYPFPAGSNVYQSTEPQSVVFSEIENYLKTKVDNYQNLYNQILEWN
ncbi:hypothetical protein J7E81_01405 [Bacillus sp. ISL-18]|uniref:hypothetical protein n=1 Tax=Bacillus sp. ISL-18 TaxID=2819118 RepID=UPI001BEC7EE0|nr:hypothetical protein [Bacillus sp. ISL-18]MBT2653902.1 hypothetical protein [Bacillus sp. ISL-18]